MAKGFTEESKEQLRIQMLETGYAYLKEGGLQAIVVEKITKDCFVAKGTFYNLFPSKAEYIYQMMLYKRMWAKEKIKEYLNRDGRLLFEGLYRYLIWLCEENPNVFAYLHEKEVASLLREWPVAYLENRENDEHTVMNLIELLEKPKEDADWELFCNYLKLGAMVLQRKEYLIPGTQKKTLEELMKSACAIVAE